MLGTAELWAAELRKRVHGRARGKAEGTGIQGGGGGRAVELGEGGRVEQVSEVKRGQQRKEGGVHSRAEAQYSLGTDAPRGGVGGGHVRAGCALQLVKSADEWMLTSHCSSPWTGESSRTDRFHEPSSEHTTHG